MVFYLAFTAFLRVDEFIYTVKNLEDEKFAKWFLTYHSVRLYENHLKLILSIFKTDSFRQNITLTIIVINDEIYTIRALRYLFQQWPAAPISSLFKSKIYSPFTRNTIINNLRQALRSESIQDYYFGHFFYRGAVISARLVGLTDNEIILLKRWKSDYYRLYIEIYSAHILIASRRHQTIQI